MIHVTLTPTERRVLIAHSKQGANDLGSLWISGRCSQNAFNEAF